MTGSPIDLSGWDRREKARRDEAQQLLARLESRREELRRILKRYGVSEAHVFGSIARGSPRVGSDVDIAVAGCPPERFYRLAAELERALGMPLDLVDLGCAPPDLALVIRREGKRLVP